MTVIPKRIAMTWKTRTRTDSGNNFVKGSPSECAIVCAIAIETASALTSAKVSSCYSGFVMDSWMAMTIVKQ